MEHLHVLGLLCNITSSFPSLHNLGLRLQSEKGCRVITVRAGWQSFGVFICLCVRMFLQYVAAVRLRAV